MKKSSETGFKYFHGLFPKKIRSKKNKSIFTKYLKPLEKTGWFKVIIFMDKI